MHWHIGKHKQKRDLTDHRPDDVEGLQLDELIPVEPEVLFQTRNVGIVYRSRVSDVCVLNGYGWLYALRFD
jgi:hypothetical protein